MKKLFILMLGMCSLAGLASCNEEDDIRNDIDGLNARLDALTDDLEALNANIQSFYEVAKGLTFVTSYEMDEKGNYTFSLSDGTELVVYGGQPEEDIPVVGINEDGNWTYSVMGEVTVLTDDEGNPVSARPVDGKDGQTPVISIDEEGYWCYRLAGEEPKRIGGRYGYADIADIPASIFVGGVKVEGNKITFSLSENPEDDVTVHIGGLDMTFSASEVTIKQGGTETLTVTQTNVSGVIIEPTKLKVTLAENEVTIRVPADLEPGEYMIYFQIYSPENYRTVKGLKVEVTSAEV